MHNLISLFLFVVCGIVAVPLHAVCSAGCGFGAGGKGNGGNDWDLFLSEMPEMTLVRAIDKNSGYPYGRQWRGMPLLKDGENLYGGDYNANERAGSVRNTYRVIPPKLVRKYVLQGQKCCVGQRCRYCYGGKKLLVGGDVACIVYHEMPDYPVAFGKGATEVLLIVYSDDGMVKARHLVGVERNGIPSCVKLSLFGNFTFEFDKLTETPPERLESWPEMRVIYADTAVVMDVAGGVATLGHEEYVLIADSTYRLVLGTFLMGGIRRLPLRKITGGTGNGASKVVVSSRRGLVGGVCAPVGNAAIVDEAYHALKAMPGDSALARRFFDVFPGSRAQFLDTYRLRIGKEFDQHMFCEAIRHVCLFQNLRGWVPDSLYVRKFIGLFKNFVPVGLDKSVHGELVMGVFRDIYSYCGDELFRQLGKMSSQQQFDFWRSAYTGDVFCPLWLEDFMITDLTRPHDSVKVPDYTKKYPEEYGILKDVQRWCRNNILKIGSMFMQD